MPAIELRGVSNFALRGVDLEVRDGELMVILGPNGAGKTTLLNVIAGLVSYEGSVLFDGAPVDDIPPRERGIGYVPQSLALFTHMTVWDNVAYGLKLRGLPEDEVRARVKEALSLLGIEHLKDRYPRRLSGGEQQRVALARALVIEPRVLLLDEPFSNLDAPLKRTLRSELRSLQSRTGITTLFVTHDASEAEELADRVAVMIGGRVIQVGTFEQIFFNPSAREVANLLGSQNVLECEGYRVVSQGLAEALCGDLRILVPYDGGAVRKVAIPPDKVVLSRDRSKRAWFNTFKGVVERIEPSRPSYRVEISLGRFRLLAMVLEGEMETLGLREGDEIYVKLPIKHVRILVDGSE
ncbi:MAG TPA: ABC transporter ATP-binding protein [Candidatus Korarchaeota archaeon]|nr:ABC transporter ATP-binding protein [Candidatus Korarchaeota archaeon]